ncbi:hypothetical protein N8447_00680 [bacterium]|jgi:hypothetical protein|nr:hypothetical protein [bacterium]|tara:strand:+ start:2741 stop:3802 length:1062 start_codon:yes stop_codon:yes gene_type:complete
MEQQLSQLQTGLTKMKNKEAKIYFLTQDTEGRAIASVAINYQYVKILKEAGYNASILYEKKEYKGVSEWLPKEYAELPHASIETGELRVGPQDFVIIPELYGHVLEQIKEMPCTKMIFCQAYDYILETLQPGFSWSNYGVTKCITTTDSQKEYINNLFPSIQTDVIKPSIPEYFKVSKKPKTPLVAIHTRDPRDTMKIIKEFYLRNPQFKWLTFRDMRNISREEFATILGEACVGVWVDRVSGFGTFPLEAMACKTPVIGNLPILKPDWLSQENGLWVYDESKIGEVLGNYVKNWLEDNLPDKLYEEMEKTIKPYSEENERNEVVTYFDGLFKEKTEEFNNSINKLSPVGVNA